MDLSGLAKAAVAGDEKALDMFSAWRPRTAGHRLTLQPRNNDSVAFYIASLLGKKKKTCVLNRQSRPLLFVD